MVQDAESYFSNALLDRFDIVAWDPRGSGESTAIDCGNKLDYFFATDKSPDDAAEVAANLAAARQLANDVRERSAALLPHLSSSATVDDMDAIRAALGEEKLTYLGFSYGTYLGALYADRYPDPCARARPRRRARSLARLRGVTRDQAVGFDSALRRVPRRLRAQRLRVRRAAIRTAPYERSDRPDRRRAVAGRGRRRAARRSGPAKPTSVSRARSTREPRAGHPRRTRSSAPHAATARRCSSSRDVYTGREPGGTYDNSQAAFFGIGCLDAPAPTIDEFPAVAAAGRAGRAGVRRVDHVAVVAVLGVAGARGGSTRAGARRRCAADRGARDVERSRDPVRSGRRRSRTSSSPDTSSCTEGEGHTAYARGNECIDDAVDDYLIDAEGPAGRARLLVRRGRG